MNAFAQLIEACNKFKQNALSVEEFQRQIEAVLLPDECKHTLEKVQHNASNRLEEILYCYAESQREYANEVADELIQAAIKEEKRLKDYRPYKA